MASREEVTRQREALDAEAQELRAQGLTYREIGERMGESTENAWKRCNRKRTREHTRRYKAANREQLREYNKRYYAEQTANCPRCGREYNIGRPGRLNSAKKGERVTFDNCPGCRRERAEQIVEWWAAGLTQKAICERLGWTRGHLAAEMDRLRGEGYDLPYRRRTGKRNATKYPHLRRPA